jgi:hypothetical protein
LEEYELEERVRPAYGQKLSFKRGQGLAEEESNVDLEFDQQEADEQGLVVYGYRCSNRGIRGYEL